MPKKILSQAVKLDIEPHFSPAVRNALNNYLKVVSGGRQKQDEWSNSPQSKFIKIDKRDFAAFSWMMSGNIENPTAGPGYEHALNFAFVNKKERHELFNAFYDKKLNVDFRDFDFSTLSGNDTSKKEKGETLTKSEKDLLTFLQLQANNQGEQTHIEEDPDFFFNRRDLLTPKEQFKMALNSNYETSAINVMQIYVKHRSIYTDGFELRDPEDVKVHRQNFELEKKSPISTHQTEAQQFEVEHQMYAYRMAMVNGEPNPPKPQIGCKIPANWHPEAARDIANAIRNGGSIADCDDNQRIMNSIYFSALFPHFMFNFDKNDNALDNFNNVFIDEIPVTEYAQKLAKGSKIEKLDTYKALVLDAIFSGEHTVETGVRYMKSDGKMDLTYMAVEPDLTVIANAERERHSWFRRLFDFGPFKISTCKTKQAARRHKDTINKKTERHDEMDRNNQLKKRTLKNPYTPVFDKQRRLIEQKRYAVRGTEKLALDNWIQSTAEQQRISRSDPMYAANFNIFSKHGQWDLGTAFRNCVDSVGIGNAVNVFTKLDKANARYNDSPNTEKARDIYNNLTTDYRAEITKEQTFNSLMDYFFKHGSMEHADASMILEIAGEVAINEEQKDFVDSLKAMNHDREEYDRTLQEIAKKEWVGDGNEKITEEQYKIIQKGQVQIKFNKMICDSITSQLSDKILFDSSILESKNATTIKELAMNDCNSYNKMLDKITAEVGVDKEPPKTIKETLQGVHTNINTMSENIKNAVSRALNGDQKVAEQEAPEKQAQKNKEVQAPVNVNPVLA